MMQSIPPDKEARKNRKKGALTLCPLSRALDVPKQGSQSLAAISLATASKSTACVLYDGGGMVSKRVEIAQKRGNTVHSSIDQKVI